MTLVMVHYQWGRLLTGCSQWRLGTGDKSSALFPDHRRMSRLFKQHVPAGGKLRILARRSNCLVIQIPAGIPPNKREPFVRAVEQETVLR